MARSDSALDVLVVHTSDLHLGSEIRGADSLAPLRGVLTCAHGAQLLLIAGDLFDNNRVPLALLDASVALLADAGLQTVILPGNHDPLTTDSVYRRGPFDQAPNVAVLGLSGCESATCDQWSLHVWGRAHRAYGDMPPIAESPPRTTRWRIAMAHGHYEEPGARPEDHTWRPSWRIRDEDLAAAGADYIALGHWERAAAVGPPSARAHYSGSPTSAGTVNLVRLAPDGGVHVTRRPVPNSLTCDPHDEGGSAWRG